MDPLIPETLQCGVVRTAPVTARPPSPPYIHIPTPLLPDNGTSTSPYLITPLCDDPDTIVARGLTPEDARIITGGHAQRASSAPFNHNWVYEDRRKAQRILDFVFLGPMAAVRDREWLIKEGITLLLAARDGSMVEARIMMLPRVATELNIEAAHLDVASKHELVGRLDHAVDMINMHMLQFHHTQVAEQRICSGPDDIDSSKLRRGKVLVFDETGNERSAAIVAAYLMAMYGRSMIEAVQFVAAQRLCANFDEETKYHLQTYEDLLRARRMTTPAIHHLPSLGTTAAAAVELASRQRPWGPRSDLATSLPQHAVLPSHAKKRRIAETMEEDDDTENTANGSDMARYEDRAPFVPFVEGEVEMGM